MNLKDKKANKYDIFDRAASDILHHDE